MVATVLAAAALAAAAPHAHPCRAPLPPGPAVPAPIVLWTSCGSFRLAPDGRVSRLPRHWLAKHGSGTGRRWGAQLDIHRSHAGRFLLLLHGRVDWRSHDLYPRDGGEVAFGPHEFAFASYHRGVYLTDLHRPERLVARGRGLSPYDFTSSGDLIVAGGRTIALLDRQGTTLPGFLYRLRNSFSFDGHNNNLYFVTPNGTLGTAHGTRVQLGRQLPGVDGTISTAQPDLLVFSGAHSVTVTRRDGTLVARTAWHSPHLSSDSGVAVSPNGSAFAFRLSDAHPGSRSSTATVYLLQAGATRAQPIYQHRLGASGRAVGANLTWHGQNLLYSSSDGQLTILDTRGHPAIDLTKLARALPHRSPAERALADWHSDFRR